MSDIIISGSPFGTGLGRKSSDEIMQYFQPIGDSWSSRRRPRRRCASTPLGERRYEKGEKSTE